MEIQTKMILHQFAFRLCQQKVNGSFHSHSRLAPCAASSTKKLELVRKSLNDPGANCKVYIS